MTTFLYLLFSSLVSVWGFTVALDLDKSYSKVPEFIIDYDLEPSTMYNHIFEHYRD